MPQRQSRNVNVRCESVKGIGYISKKKWKNEWVIRLICIITVITVIELNDGYKEELLRNHARALLYVNTLYYIVLNLDYLLPILTLFSSSFSHLFHILSFFFPLQTWAYLSVSRPLRMSHSFDSSGKVNRHQLFTFCSQLSIPGYVSASSWLKCTDTHPVFLSTLWRAAVTFPFYGVAWVCNWISHSLKWLSRSVILHFFCMFGLDGII